ncbi:hypothetical protein F5Y04DRAFT_289052 [Hypomontagnella monticulosa]|nr:hypothetical protein F5Y04DRAFT_289052 [Hypomontagnella monticulosa]
MALSEEELVKDQRVRILPTLIAFNILPVIAVTLRIVTRRVTRQEIWYDDWLTIISAVLCLVKLAIVLEELRYGLGKHVQVVPPASLEPYFIYTFLNELLYTADVTLIKLSILTLYLRLFNVNPCFKRLCYVMMVFVLAMGISSLFATIFQCAPVPAAWDKTTPGSKCLDLVALLVGLNIPNILIDVVIIALPMPLLWSLKLSLGRKLGLIGLFLVAAFATVVSVLRCIYNADVDQMDPTWGYVPTSILSTVEVGVGICCACLPVMYPLFRFMIGRRITSEAHTDSNGPPFSYGGHSSRIRQRLPGCDQGLSDTDQLWSTSTGGNKLSKEQRGIPLNRIMVTRDISVWSPSNA